MKKLSFFFFFLSTSIFATTTFPPESVKGRQHAKFTKRYWAPELFSSPAWHNDESFIYIVHKIDGQRGEINKATHHFATLLSKDPFKVSQNPRLSASVINQDHRTMYEGSIALVLEVPHENVGPMHTMDMNVPSTPRTYEVSAKYFTKQLVRSSGVYQRTYSPYELVKRTDRFDYNEVLLLGKNLSKPNKQGQFKSVRPSGILVECNDNYSFEQASKKIRVDNFPEAFHCLTGKQLNVKFTELKEELKLKEFTNNIEKRTMYLINLFEFNKANSNKLPVILMY
ncbi:MAG: hypothetical protein KC478_06455 [Bacteriovoracaceae bacterium]|nr:hypothetical protein [Bacteriovoracaceae bacterium]